MPDTILDARNTAGSLFPVYGGGKGGETYNKFTINVKNEQVIKCIRRWCWGKSRGYLKNSRNDSALRSFRARNGSPHFTKDFIPPLWPSERSKPGSQGKLKLLPQSTASYQYHSSNANAFAEPQT